LKEAGIRVGDIQGIKDIEKLPFTTKNDLRDTYPFGMFCVNQKQLVRFHASSGTTGKPTVVGYTRDDLREWSNSLGRALTSIGCDSSDIIQVGYGYGLFTGGLGFHYAAEAIGASVIPMSSGNTRRQIELMYDLSSTTIACTPSYFLHMIEIAREMGIDFHDTNLVRGVFGAEPWSENTRHRIENATGIDAYDVYGTSEISGPMFTECTEKNGIHIWGDLFYVEVIDPDTGEQVGEGEKGELVLTSLRKEALPLLRYRTGDITMLDTEPCACGRAHPRIMRILGRTDDMLIVRGVNVFPSQIEDVLMRMNEVGEHYQIVLERDGALDVMTVQVEVTPNAFSDKVGDLMSIRSKVASTLKTVLGISVNVELVEHGTLPRSTGKAQRVIDKREL
ncbi:MAG: phenylacetate--CoA ligase family protein, partial [Methermicoccaceae archaeon]